MPVEIQFVVLSQLSDLIVKNESDRCVVVGAISNLVVGEQIEKSLLIWPFGRLLCPPALLY